MKHRIISIILVFALVCMPLTALADAFTPSDYMEYYERSYSLVDAVLSSKKNKDAADSLDWQKCNVIKVDDDPVTYKSKNGDFTIVFNTNNVKLPANYARIVVTNRNQPFAFAYPFVTTFCTYGNSIDLNLLVDAFRWLDLAKELDDPKLGPSYEPNKYYMTAVQPGNQYALVITVVDKNSALAKSYVELKKGSKGDAVKALQEKLNAAGYSVGKVDGDFGGKTATAISNYQKDMLLPQNGILDLATYTLLNSGAGGASSASDASTSAESVQAGAEASQSEGWYVSDDGKYAIYPMNLQRDSYGTYTVEIQVREEASKTVGAVTVLDLGQEDLSLSLSQTGAIRDFAKAGNGKYTFDVVCDFSVGGLICQRANSFTINIG